MRRAQSRDPGPLTLRTRAGSHPVLDAEKAGHRTGPRVKVSPPGAHAGQQVSAGQRYEQVSRVGREHSYEGQEPQVPKSGGSGEVFLEELSELILTKQVRLIQGQLTGQMKLIQGQGFL